MVVGRRRPPIQRFPQYPEPLMVRVAACPGRTHRTASGSWYVSERSIGERPHQREDGPGSEPALYPTSHQSRCKTRGHKHLVTAQSMTQGVHVEEQTARVHVRPSDRSRSPRHLQVSWVRPSRQGTQPRFLMASHCGHGHGLGCGWVGFVLTGPQVTPASKRRESGLVGKKGDTRALVHSIR